MDGARDDLLAGAAFAGDQDADIGVGDALRHGHRLAHVTDGHGAVLAGRELIDRPERRAFFALGARPIEVLESCQQQLDGVDRGDGLEIRFWGDEDLDVPLARRPDEQALGVRRPMFVGVP